MSNDERKAAVITGASSGIGRALAVAMADQYDLAVFARRVDRLESLKTEIEAPGRKVMTVTCDIRDSSIMAEKLEDVAKSLARIDIVIANAGFTIPGAFEKLTVEDYRCIFETNFLGSLNTIYPALPYLKQSKGTVVIIGSILGELGILDRSAYVATKFALRGFYESVRYEFKEQGISLLLAEPGFVKTELRYMDKTGKRLEEVTDQTRKKTSHGIAAPPEDVAKEILKALPKSGFRKRIVTGHAKWFAFLNWLCPGLLAAIVYKYRNVIRTKVVK